MSRPAEAGPAICFAQCVSPDGSRLSLQAGFVRRQSTATDSRGQIEIIDVDGPAEDLVRALPGDPTG